MNKETVITSDGFPITAHMFKAKNASGNTVVISGGVGLPQRFFFKFAKWLSEQGCRVYTFDYRGIAFSKKGAIAKLEASYKEWAQQDFKAVTEHAKNACPENNMLHIGHSFGGNSLGLGDAYLHYDRFLTVASQFGYFRNFPGKMQLVILVGFGFLMPVLTMVMGYFPSPWFGLGEALPKQVARDWGIMLLRKRSMLDLAKRYGENYYPKIEGPMLMLSIDDDTFAPKKSVDVLANEVYRNAKVERMHLVPKTFGLSKIGHNDFFRQRHQEQLWPIVTNWFNLEKS
ncbi:alpha/beta hydrolase family protein [Maribacter sp. 2-571]|uniref:alpha/beta hydrolase family protein n=1 Tax=Maribacter sp. 2-571 TaxID=3417569 RepID=UPI003D32D8E6